MNRKADDHHRHQITGRHVAFAFFAFFGVVVAVNLTLAWFASASWTGLVVDNSYVASQNYNERLAHARSQSGRGWHHRIEYRREKFRLVLQDSFGRPVSLYNVRVWFGRPAAEFADREIAMEDTAAGRYEARPVLQHGIWQFVIAGESYRGDYRAEGRLFVDKPGEGVLQ